MNSMINEKFVAIVLAVGLLLSIGCVVSQDKYAEDLGAKELAYQDQPGLVIPGPEDVKANSPDQGGLQSEAVVPSDVLGAGQGRAAPSVPDIVGLGDLSLYIEYDNGPITHHVVIPIGSSVYLHAVTRGADGQGLTGELLEIYPITPLPQLNPSQGFYQKTVYDFSSGFRNIPRTFDAEGTYYFLFTTNDPSNNRVIHWSNAVVIEVVPA